MKYLMLVCWDAESMNGLTEPKPGDVQDEELPVARRRPGEGHLGHGRSARPAAARTLRARP